MGENSAGIQLQASEKVRNQRTGSQWQVKLIGLIWDQWRKVWTMRKLEVHGHDIATRAQTVRAATDRDLREVNDRPTPASGGTTGHIHIAPERT